MIVIRNALFNLGEIVATPGAIKVLEDAKQGPLEFVQRHAKGDWGEELCSDDCQLNNDSIGRGSQILSAYKLKTGVKIWVITDAANQDGEREVTTILLPDEY